MSDTPETDAAQHEGLLRTSPIPMQVVTANFARKLERDEARKELNEQKNRASYNLDLAKRVRDFWEKCEKERDEARHEIEGWRNKWECAVEMAARAEFERDAARASLKDITEYGTEEINAAVELRQKLAQALAKRDEAREQIRELIYIAERAIALAEIDFENDKFGVVSELRDALMSIKVSTSK
jgi:hypothetical protein